MLHVEILHVGASPERLQRPKANDVVGVHYATMLSETGRLADTSRTKQQTEAEAKPFTVVIGSGSVVPGFEQGILRMGLGTLARIHCPASLGYGADGSCGSVPPHADLVFELEIVRLNDTTAAGLRTPELRHLLALPVMLNEQSAAQSAPLAVNAAHSVGASTALKMAAVERDAARAPDACCDSDADDETVEAVETGGPLTEAYDEGEATWRRWPWLARLRPRLVPPIAESAHFFRLMEQMGDGGWRAALGCKGAPSGDGTDGAQQLLPGSLPIRRCPYGTKFDSRTPMVLTGPRARWPGFRWGWRFWGGAHGEDLGTTCKQRAPIFDSDQPQDHATAEASLREFIDYARHAHERPLDSQKRLPLLYMNGWEVRTRGRRVS